MQHALLSQLYCWLLGWVLGASFWHAVDSQPEGPAADHKLLHICAHRSSPCAFSLLVRRCTSTCVQSLPSDRPWIIAHGGASGPLPGNTLQAFQRAIAVGANFITCEVVVTKDQQVGVLLLSVLPCVLSAGLKCGIIIKNGLQS